MNRIMVAFAFACALCLALYAPASAREYSHGRTVLFHDVFIAPGDVVNGDLNVLFGNVTVAGTVHGDLNVIGGTYQTLPGAEIDGEIHSAAADSLMSIAPWMMSTHAMYPFAQQSRHLWVKLASSIIVLVVFLLFPMRVRLALERVERHPGLSAAVGTLALVAVLPVAILLVLSIIGIPLVILEIAAVFVGICIGQGAISLLVGRRFYELISPNRTPSPLGALILGLILISAAEIVPVVGWAVTALVYLVGLGATILAFAREGYLRAMYTGTPFGGNPPYGGPPMNRPA
ncbi:MAG TPA: polymer-forming cytoskeletal protein [Candidatus Binatia bacterium]|nr:polymer-forming cytoskeletal protein [Candidatus Binatia bacterium]